MADRPGSDVVEPGVGVAGERSGAVKRVLPAHRARGSAVRARIRGAPLVEGGEEGRALGPAGLGAAGIVVTHATASLALTLNLHP